MKKRVLSVLLAAAMMVTLLAGCGSKDKSDSADSKSDSNTITVWGWDKNMNGYAMEQAQKAYGKDVKVKFVEMAKADALTKLHTVLGSGTKKDLPDIVLVSDLNAQGYLMSYPDAFREMSDKINYDDFAAYKKEAVSYDGKSYGVPFDTGVAGLFYRTDYMNEIGYTADKMQNLTWDEFFSLGEKLKAKGHLLQTYNPNDISEFQIYLQSAGKWFTDDKGKADFKDNAALKESFDIFKKLNDADYCKVVSDWTEFSGAINGGDVATVLRGSWITSTLMAQPDQKGKWAVAPIPKMSTEGATQYSNQGGSSWFVLKNSANSDLAADFMSKTFGGDKDLYNTLLSEKSIVGTYLPASDVPAYGEASEFFGGQKINELFADWMEKIPAVNTGAFSAESQAALLAVAPKLLDGGDYNDAMKEAAAQFEQSVK